MFRYANAFCPGTRSVTARFIPLVSIGTFEMRYPSSSRLLSVALPGRKFTCVLVKVLYPVNGVIGGTGRSSTGGVAAKRLAVGINCLTIDGLLHRNCITA